MARTNELVEAILYEYAELLAISGSDPYKPRSYEKAARSIGGYHADLKDLDTKGILAIPNVWTFGLHELFWVAPAVLGVYLVAVAAPARAAGHGSLTRTTSACGATG